MKKILIIDDDPDILEAVQLVFQTSGYGTEAITRAEEVYQKIDQYQPNLIILDVLLSGNDGRVICKNLKVNETTKKIPIIVISAHPTAKESVRVSGADSFVPKPFSVTDLLTEVEKFISFPS